MKDLYKSILIVPLIVALTSCNKKEPIKTISVKNMLDVERTFETVELTKELLKIDDLSGLAIRNMETKVLELTQEVDYEDDGIIDVILFQPKINANAETDFEIVKITDEQKPKAENLCYSRFVPERTDDYAWENNKVAFRIYGPTAQRLKEKNDPNGTLSSGVDAWLKKVEYPIINKWYKKTTTDTGTYHEDTGEGLDNFHVGISRGVGGIAAKVDGNYYYSKNYIKWRTITTGPIRTSFYLEYENWDAQGNTIKESRIVSLDLGQNFSKFDISIKGINKISAGLTLHEKDGIVSGNTKKGWVSYWQPHGNSELGTAIVASKDYFIDFETYDTDLIDQSNAYANLNIIDNKVIYYAGFTWKESGQFHSKPYWENYLNTFSDCINNPLEVSIKK